MAENQYLIAKCAFRPMENARSGYGKQGLFAALVALLERAESAGVVESAD